MNASKPQSRFRTINYCSISTFFEHSKIQNIPTSLNPRALATYYVVDKYKKHTRICLYCIVLVIITNVNSFMLYMYTCFRYWYVNIMVKYDFRYPCSQRYCYIYIVAYTCTKDPVHHITVSGLPKSFLPIYSHIYWHSIIYICNYILKFSPSIRYHATLYTHCVYIYIPSDLPDLPNRHSPKQYVPHLYPLLNTISPHYYIHYSPFLLVKSGEFPLKLAISVVLLWKKPIETSSPFFGWLKPC